MGFWMCDSQVYDMAKGLIEKYHPHLVEAKIALLFSDKRKSSGNRLVLGVCKRVSNDDKVLSGYDFKIILSAEDWGELTSKERQALLDHELSHCDVERVPMMEIVNGKKKPVRDKYGRKLYTEEIQTDDNGKPKWKIRPHDFENFIKIQERYGLEIASMIGGYPPVDNRRKVESEAKVVESEV